MTNHFIEFENVSYTYPGVERPAVANATFSVDEGEIVLVTGPSGAGKTTLCSMLNRMVPESYGGSVEGRITIDGTDISQYTMGQMAFISGMLFQDPSGQLISPTVSDEIAFGPENKGTLVAKIDCLVEQYGGCVNMTPYMERAPQALSGGQQQSVAYAAVLAMEPEIYVLDEPTSNLDPLGSDLVFSLIHKIASAKQKTVFIVEHKLEKIIDLVDRIIVLDKGKIAFNGTPQEVLRHTAELERIGVLAPQMTRLFSRLNAELGLDLRLETSLESAIDDLKDVLPQHLPIPKLESVAQHFSQPPIHSQSIIRIRDLRFGYSPEVEVLHGIDLDIYKGEFLSIVGQNGSGKTTIVKHLNGLLKPVSGSVTVFEKRTDQATVAELSRKVGYCFQNPDHQIFSSVVRDEIAYGPQNIGESKAETQATIEKLSEVLHIGDLLDQNPHNLSKGQRQQIAVAAILAMKPDVLIVDEPTTGQDPRQSHEMMDMIRWLNREMSKTIVVITHDMSIAAEYSDRIVVMHQGAIIAEGTPRQIFQEEELLKSSNLEAPQIVRLLRRAGIGYPAALNLDEAFQLLSSISLQAVEVNKT